MRKLIIVILLWLTALSCTKSEPSPEQVQPPPTGSSGKFGNYFFFNDGLYCLDLDEGATRWQIDTRGHNRPVYDSGRIYTSNPYYITSTDALTGARIWSYNYSDLFYQSNNGVKKGSPEIVDSVLYTTSFIGSVGNTAVHAVSKNSGKVIWSRDLIDPVDYFQRPIPRLKVVKDIIVLTGSPFNGKNKMFVLDRYTGKILLTKTFSGIEPGYLVQADEQSAYFADRSKPQVCAVDLKTGDTKWSTTIEDQRQLQMRVSLLGDRLVYPSNKKIYVFDKKTGTVLNTISDGQYVLAYYASETTIYVKTSAYKIYAYPIMGKNPEWQIDAPFSKEIATMEPSLHWAPTGNFVLAEEDLISCDNFVAAAVQPGFNKTTFSIIDSKTGKVKKAITVDGLSNINFNDHVLVRGNRSYRSMSQSN
jgi:outer membrane protein assembly factor BamB